MDFNGASRKLAQEAQARRAAIKKQQDDNLERDRLMKARADAELISRQKFSTSDDASSSKSTTAAPRPDYSSTGAATNSGGSFQSFQRSPPPSPLHPNGSGNGSSADRKGASHGNSYMGSPNSNSNIGSGKGSDSNSNSSSNCNNSSSTSSSSTEKPIAKGDRVLYTKDSEGKGATVVTIVEVHKDDFPNVYYTIRLPDGREKQTDSKYICKKGENSALL